MTLPHVALGDPHVLAHNNERDAINSLADQIADFGSTTQTLAMLAPGLSFYVQKVGANWEYPRGTVISARPTSRTDIKMISVSTDGTVPNFAIAGWDEAETVPS